jgi:hypothetical protein
VSQSNSENYVPLARFPDSKRATRDFPSPRRRSGASHPLGA